MRTFNNLGNYSSFVEVWRRFPYGGHQGDFLFIDAQRYVWDAHHRNWMADDSTSDSYRLLHQAGDLRLDGELHVGGRTHFRQPAVFHRDVCIEGNLFCRHLSRHDCGLYATAEALMAAHPVPRRGDWALVGTTATPELWTCGTPGLWLRHDEPIALADAFHLDEYDSVRDIINDIASRGYVFAGVACPDTNPIRPADYNVFYIAAQRGEYVHFGGMHIDYCSVLMWNHGTDTDSNGTPDGQWTAQLLLGGVFVGEDNIGERAVTTPKIDDRAVTGDKIACDSIATCHIKDGEVTPEKTTGLATTDSVAGLRSDMQTALASTGANIGTLNAAVNNLRALLAQCVKSITVNQSPKLTPDQQGNVALVIRTDEGEEVIPVPAVIDDEAIQTIWAAIEPRMEAAIDEAFAEFDIQNIWGIISGNVSAAIADALNDYNPISEGAVNDIWNRILSRIWPAVSTNVAAAIAAALEQFTPSGGDDEEQQDILIGYTDLDTEGGTIDNSTFTEGGRYNISAAYILAEDVTIPAGVTIHFSQGGSIGTAEGDEYDITAQQTVLTAPANQQIFGEGVCVAGTWNIPFSRPEWFGAKNDATDYGTLPVRVYRGMLSAGAATSASKANVTAHYPNEFFNPADYVEAYNGGSSDIEAVTHQDVFYDSNENRFLILHNGIYHTRWDNDSEYNDPSGHARTDAAFFSVDEGISTTENGKVVTLAHMFTSEGSKIYLKNSVSDTDSTAAFQKAINMTGGNVRLRKGTYRLNGQGNDKTIRFEPAGNADFDGQGATLYFVPTQYEASVSQYAFFVNANAPADSGKEVVLHDFTISTANVFHGRPYASNYKRLDLLSSFITAFRHNRGNNVTYHDIHIRNCFKDFTIKYERTEDPYAPADVQIEDVLANHVTLCRIHTENSYAGIYHGFGVQHLFVENCRFNVRPHIDTGAHTFYLAYGTLYRTTSVHVSDTIVNINGGFMSQPINLQGSEGWGAYAMFTNCTFRCAALGTAGTGTRIFFDRCRYYSNGAKAVNVASVTPQSGEFNTFHLVTKGECYVSASMLKLGNKKFNTSSDSGRTRQNILQIEKSYVESNFTYTRGSTAVYTDSAGGAVLTSSGTLIARGNVFVTPNSPVISFFSTSNSGASGSDMRGKVAAKLIVENNQARCKSALVFMCVSSANAQAITEVHVDANTIIVTPTAYTYSGTTYNFAAVIGWNFLANDVMRISDYSTVTDNYITSSTATPATLYTALTSDNKPSPQGGRVFQNFLNGARCDYENDPLQNLRDLIGRLQ